MNTELYIARRIFSNKEIKPRISRPIVNIAVIGIALGFIIMILAISIVSGFKKEIRQKVVGFGSHIQITNYDANYSFETVPISKNQDFYPGITYIKGIKNIQIFATKVGVLKTDTEIQGVILKGIGSDFDWSFFEKNIVEGKSFRVSDTAKTNKILISKKIASLLNLKVGDKLSAYFIQDPPRIRKFHIEGIYETGLMEFDEMFAIVDIGHVQKLNDWDNDQISGFEILINDYNELDNMKMAVFNIAGTKFDKTGSKLKVQSVKEKYPYFFAWIRLFDTNVWVILILMTLVAGFNMVSGLLIIILERTKMIGILKSIGAENASVRKIFLYNAMFLTGKGLLWGNVIGIAICLLQHYTGLFPLDPESYYVNTVPINLNISSILLLNIGTLLVTTIMMVIPSFVITKISPIKAIQF